uniref:Pathogenesis-related thaumatin superfamily protein n=1 Tax=Zea mays TaxID=4577 RepID=B4FHK8_MAIZE|nr:unknown [Zea mays]
MGARSSSTWTQHLLLLFFLVLGVATNSSHSSTINITNRCSYTVWPAATPVGGGMQLEPGKTWVLQVPGNTQSGRVWARTGCSFDGPGKKSCQTGDCGGVLACTTSGQPPMTMAEFTLSDSNNMDDYFDITVVDGFNLPMDFLPVPSSKGSSGCSRGPRCAADITSQCPDELKVPGGCRSACNGSSCDASTVNSNTVFYARMCPDAYTYATDNGPVTYSCRRPRGRRGAAGVHAAPPTSRRSADDRRREEAPQVQARNRGAARDPQVPEEHGAADPQAALPAPGARDRAGLQDRPPVPEPRRAGAPGGRRGLPRRSLRGHQPLRHPR